MTHQPIPPGPPQPELQQGPQAPMVHQPVPCPPPQQQRMPMYPPSSTSQPSAPQMNPYGLQVSAPLLFVPYFRRTARS